MAEGELIGGIFMTGGHPNTPGMKYPALPFQRLNPVSFFLISRPLHPAHLCSVVPH